MKKCPKCNIDKSRSEFYENKVRKDGLAGRCIKCTKEVTDKWRKTNKDKVTGQWESWKTTNRERYMWGKAKSSAAKDKREFNIESSDIVIPEKCPVFNTEWTIRGPQAPSLDRIDSNKGYIKGNVQVISWKANNLKGNFELQDFEAMVSFLKNRKSYDAD
jgi:hypothetical protein